MAPQRIQRKRTKGWRMPEGAVYVGRGSKWGNHYVIQAAHRSGPFDVLRGGSFIGQHTSMESARRSAAELFKRDLLWDFTTFADMREDYLRQLRGRDLACWCPLNQPCHADVLLELANQETTDADT